MAIRCVDTLINYMEKDLPKFFTYGMAVLNSVVKP